MFVSTAIKHAESSTYLQDSFVTEKEVGGLEVPMKDPVIVEMVDSSQ